MTKRASICVASLCIVLAQPAWADFAAGKRAFDKGDYATVLKEWRPLADEGNADAQANLGVMYHEGQGGRKNYAEAHMWLNLAAARTTGDAQEKFADQPELIAKKMTAQQIAKAQRRAREWKRKSGREKGGRPMK